MATLEERTGRLTGRCVQGDCSGAEKVRRIKERFDLRQYSLLYAYGDTPDDREMLELAHRKYYRGKEVSSWDEAAEALMEQAVRREYDRLSSKR